MGEKLRIHTLHQQIGIAASSDGTARKIHSVRSGTDRLGLLQIVVHQILAAWRPRHLDDASWLHLIGCGVIRVVEYVLSHLGL